MKTGFEMGRWRTYVGCTNGTIGLCAALCRNSVFCVLELRLGPLWLIVLRMHRVNNYAGKN